MGIFRNVDLLLFIIEKTIVITVLSPFEMPPWGVNCVNTTLSSPYSHNFLTAIGASHWRRIRTHIACKYHREFVCYIKFKVLKMIKNTRLHIDHLKQFAFFYCCVTFSILINLVKKKKRRKTTDTLSKVQSVPNKNKLLSAKYYFPPV